MVAIVWLFLKTLAEVFGLAALLAAGLVIPHSLSDIDKEKGTHWLVWSLLASLVLLAAFITLGQLKGN